MELREVDVNRALLGDVQYIAECLVPQDRSAGVFFARDQHVAGGLIRAADGQDEGCPGATQDSSLSRARGLDSSITCMIVQPMEKQAGSFDQREVGDSPHPQPLQRDLIAHQAQLRRGLLHHVLTRICGAEHERASAIHGPHHCVSRKQNAPWAGKKKARKHEARNERQHHEPDEHFHHGNGVAVQAIRMHVAVADRRQSLHAENMLAKPGGFRFAIQPGTRRYRQPNRKSKPRNSTAMVPNNRGQLTVMKWWYRSWKTAVSMPCVTTSRPPILMRNPLLGLPAVAVADCSACGFKCAKSRYSTDRRHRIIPHGSMRFVAPSNGPPTHALPAPPVFAVDRLLFARE